jgi:hypothetical protein
MPLKVVFAQARYPTAKKSKKYAELIEAIQSNATSLPGIYAFPEVYTLGADGLTLSVRARWSIPA